VRKILTLVLAAGLFAALPPTHSQSPRSARGLEAGIRESIEAVRPLPRAAVSPKQPTCVGQTISCGQTITSTIATTDCATAPPPIYFDVFFFQGNAGQTITATMSSNDFDSFLILFSPEPNVDIVAEDDNSGGGLTARLVHTLDETSDSWSLTPTPLEENVTGTYTLTLQCSGGGPPPPPPPPDCPTGFFPDPNYPDFCFAVTITPSGQAGIDGTREADCIEDTVCVSGALAGRSEVFLRILGPRPNGFLWPTITRFTPSRVDVDIVQRSSGDSQSYTLPAVPAASDDLSGLQDRMGFLP